MIRSEFFIPDQRIHSFSVEGHSGLAPAPHDILCATVSGMTMLTLNTLQEVFGATLRLTVDEDHPLIQAELIDIPKEKEEAVQGVLRGLLLQLQDLQEQYPKHLAVCIK